MDKKLNIIDLFCGCGGLSLGVKMRPVKYKIQLSTSKK